MSKNRNNPELVVCIGVPASGKSSWSKDYVRNNPEWIRINRDDYREMFKTAQVCDPKIEGLITETVNNAVHLSLSKKLNVILDATHVKEKYINDILNEFKYEADISYRVFDISLKKAIERDSQREKKVGEQVIKVMYENYLILKDSFHFQPQPKASHRPVIKPNFESELQDVVIIDIDGTVSLLKDRGPFDWTKVGNDDPNWVVAELIEFHVKKNRKIILLSGRDGSCRKETEQWLQKHDIYYDCLYMRPADDYRKDYAIKKEIYYNEIRDKYNVICAIDDRLSITKLWFEEDIFCFNVNQGGIIF